MKCSKQHQLNLTNYKYENKHLGCEQHKVEVESEPQWISFKYIGLEELLYLFLVL